MRQKLLIIAPYQFGELSDCYYWAKYATNEGWSVTYIGYKYRHRGVQERKCPKVKVKSVMHYNNRRLLGVMFYMKCIFEILLHNHQNVIICRMPMCQLLPKLFPYRNIILDVRTLSVSKEPNIRERQDNELRKVKTYFKKCSVISEGVGQKIGPPYALLPLGAEHMSIHPKIFDTMRLFYIGTFDNRNLSVFIDGLARYQQMTKNKISFDIVGGGSIEETEKIKRTIKVSGVNNVRMHGYLTHEEAQSYFDNCNVGVCFIPVTDYYQYQPPTKLYEYLLSGMVAISTNTISNEKVMSEVNGVIVNDNAESVYDGLRRLAIRLNHYKSDDIVAQSQEYHWSEIVKRYLLPLMK